MFAWNIYGAIGVGVGLVSFLAAVVVFRAAPARATNRSLALLLLLEGGSLSSGSGLILMAVDPAAAYASKVVNIVVFLPLPFAYLAFLGRLPIPWMAWAKTRTYTVVAIAMTAVFEVFLFTSPELLIAGLYATPIAAWDALQGPLLDALAFTTIFVQLLGLAAALWLWRASSGAGRRQAGWYAWAFGWRDVLVVVLLILVVFVPVGAYWRDAASFLLWDAAILGWLALLSYGVVKAQVLDIDLKIKFGISRGTVAAIIAATALVGSELLEAALGIDRVVPAVVIGAGMALAFRPLSRLGDRLADKALPGVEDTDAYRGRRAREIYRAAYDSALQDGIVSEKERDVLEALARSLGLPKRTAKTIETEIP